MVTFPFLLVLGNSFTTCAKHNVKVNLRALGIFVEDKGLLF